MRHGSRRAAKLMIDAPPEGTANGTLGGKGKAGDRFEDRGSPAFRMRPQTDPLPDAGRHQGGSGVRPRRSKLPPRLTSRSAALNRSARHCPIAAGSLRARTTPGGREGRLTKSGTRFPDALAVEFANGPPREEQNGTAGGPAGTGPPAFRVALFGARAARAGRVTVRGLERLFR